MMGRRATNVGMIAKRLAGMDGVSLEAAKWSQVFEQEGLNCYYLAGELDRPMERSFPVAEAHFTHPEIRELTQACFGRCTRSRQVTQRIHKLKDTLKEAIYTFITKFEIDFLVTENAITIPLNIPLGMAITEVISETGMPTIAHHHDFFWDQRGVGISEHGLPAASAFDSACGDKFIGGQSAQSADGYFGDSHSQRDGF